MKHGNGGWIAIGGVLLGISVASWVFQPVKKRVAPHPTTAATPSSTEPRRSTTDLLKVAKRVGRLPGGDRTTYFWRSDTEIVALHPSPEQPALFRLTALNTRTGKARPLRELNAAFGGLLRGHRTQVTVVGRRGAQVTYEPPVAALSPEGRSLLWFGGRLFWHAATLHGEVIGRWRQPSPLLNQAVWLRDGQRWAEVETDLREGLHYLRRIHVHDLRNPQAERTVEIPALEDGFVLGFTPEEKLLIRHGSATEPRETPETEGIALTQVDLSGERGRLDRYTIRLPDSSRVVECALSPAGDRLAWVLQPSPAGTRQSPYYSLWTSGLRGEALIQVGSTPGKSSTPGKTSTAREDPENGMTDGPEALRWLPDGKQVSFRLRDSLHVLPVN